MKYAVMIAGPTSAYGSLGRYLSFSTFSQVVGQKERPRADRDNNIYHQHAVLLYDGMTLETLFREIAFGIAAPKSQEARSAVSWDANGGLVVAAVMREPPMAAVEYASLGEHHGYECILIHKPFVKESDRPDSVVSVRRVPVYGERSISRAFNHLRRMIAGESHPSGPIHVEDEKDRWLKLDLLDVFYHAGLAHNKAVLTEAVEVDPLLDEDDGEE